jgi:dienelactone hydrolase
MGREKMKSTLQILIDARKLIEKPEDWATGSVATGCCFGGRTTGLCAEQAIGCAMGLEWGDLTFYQPNPAKAALAQAIGCRLSVYAFNDISTHAEVLAAFDKAIAAERAKLDKIGAQVKSLIAGALRDDLGTISPDRADGKPSKRSLVNHT